MLISGARRCKKFASEEYCIRPITIPQLLCIIISVFPPYFVTMGFWAGKHLETFLPRMTMVVILLLLSCGLRVGELIPRLQKNIPYSVRARLPCLGNVLFFPHKGTDQIAISEYRTKKMQLQFLIGIHNDHNVLMKIGSRQTKPGRHRIIVLKHFH